MKLRNLSALLLGAALFAVPTPAPAAWPAPTPKDQKLYVSGSTIVSNAVSISAGHLAVFQIMARGNTIASVDDDSGGGNTWQIAGTSPCQRGANTDYVATYYSVLVGALSSAHVTAHLGGAPTSGATVLWDVTGQAASPEDNSVKACAFNNSAVSNPSVTSGAPSQADDIIFTGYAIPSTTAGYTVTPAGSWSTISGTGNTSVGLYTQYLDNTGSSAAQTNAPTTNASKTYMFNAVGFKRLGGAAPVICPVLATDIGDC